MEVMKGTAEKVRNTTSVSGGGNNGHISTTHISLFKLDGLQVSIRSNEPPVIDDGDAVVVAGDLDKGLLKAYAYKNLTTGVYGNEGLNIMLLFGIIFPIVGIYFFNEVSDSRVAPPYLFQGISLVFVFVGVYFLYRSKKVFSALKIIKSES